MRDCPLCRVRHVSMGDAPLIRLGEVTEFCLLLVSAAWWTSDYLSLRRLRPILRLVSHYLDCLASGAFCPLCYAGRKGRAVYKGHFGWRAHRKASTCMSIARRSPEPSGGASSGCPGPAMSGLWQAYPDLFDFLTAAHWPDGKSRLTGTLLLFTDAAAWKCWLHDKDAGMGCFVTGESVEKALEAAERAVGSSGGDWRPDRKPPGKRS